MSDQYIITTFVNDQIRVWQGNYGWATVRMDHTPSANSGHRYMTRQDAERALKRMLKRYPNSLTVRNAKIIKHWEIWLNPDGYDTTLNIPLLTGAI